jgi:hypothetical protein
MVVENVNLKYLILQFSKGGQLPQRLTISILITKQYPKGLRKTVPEIKMELESILPIEMVSSSCCGVKTSNHPLNHLGRK